MADGGGFGDFGCLRLQAICGSSTREKCGKDENRVLEGSGDMG